MAPEYTTLSPSAFHSLRHVKLDDHARKQHVFHRFLLEDVVLEQVPDTGKPLDVDVDLLGRRHGTGPQEQTVPAHDAVANARIAQLLATSVIRFESCPTLMIIY
jgi:hypothetical protein